MEVMAGFIKGNGEFKNLQVYKMAVIISVATDIFVKRFIDSRSRTTDQMQQAARSCKQNLVEGSDAAPTSKETEIKLTNVARASLGELLEDYEDYLRFNSLEVWGVNHPRVERLRDYLKKEAFEQEYPKLLPKLNGEEFCNLMITLILQERRLIDGLLKRQQQRFLEDGGIREAMTRSRLETRKNQNSPNNRNNPNNPSPPITPITPSPQITPKN